MHVVHSPVDCAPTEEGRYEVVGFLTIPGHAEVEIGSFGLLATRSSDILYGPYRQRPSRLVPR